MDSSTPAARFSAALLTARGVPFDHPDDTSPEGYYGKLLDADPEAVRRQIEYTRELFRFARLDPAGTKVLEVGSGFGLGLVACASLGATPIGLEIVPWQAEWARRVVAALELDIRIETGSAVALPFEDGSVDMVLSLEAISHYLDYKPFLTEARRVLRPGGVLVISDGNNGLNPKIVRKTHKIWALHERDDDSGYPFNFVSKRQAIVQAAEPTIDESKAHLLALRTSGMVRGDIVKAAAAYVSDGTLPASPYQAGQLSVHPEHEMVMERLFNPYKLAREIDAYGFTSRVRGHWGGGSPAVVAADRVLAALTPVTLFSARAFRIASKAV